MVLEAISCPNCKGTDVVKFGKTANGKQRFHCQNESCVCQTFILDYSDLGRLPETKKRIIEMAINGSGIRDTSRVLKISPTTVINEIKKKESDLESVNEALIRTLDPNSVKVDVQRVDEAEMDEMWSFVGKKRNQRWLWHAIDHQTGKVLAYVLGRRKDKVFLKLKKLLDPFKIRIFYTDDWGAYDRHIEKKNHEVGKRNTQKIERKHLTLRTRIKRLTRRTICFSKSNKMHDIVIGLFINHYEFGLPVC